MKKNNLEQLLMAQVANSYKPINIRTGRCAVSYTRVSSSEQAMNNGSLEVQLKLNKEYAQRNNILIKECFGGTFESAKEDGRKEFTRMLAYARKNKEVTYILVSNYDRFSRTGAGAAKISEDLRKEGIILKSVTQDIDTGTPTGRLQENFIHNINNFDNITKSDRTKLNTREVMLKGYWPYATPLGYINLKRKERACFHQYAITDEGKELKKIFYLKAEGKLSNREIIEKLQARGVRINEKMFRQIISNPFYAGYVTGRLLEGKLVRGKHPQLIDLKIFLKANKVLNENPIAGIAKIFRHEQVPLKIFARDEISGSPLTGYSTKNIWYYKTKSSDLPLNINADKLNNYFATYLAKFEFQQQQKSALKKKILNIIANRLSKTIEEEKLLKKLLTEKKGQLEKIEKKFLNDVIDKELYDKHAYKIRGEINALTEDLQKTEITSSNFEKSVEKCLALAQNLSSTWVVADFENKRRLQQLVFPEGIVYSKEKGGVRTFKTNTLFSAIPMMTRVLTEKEKGNLKKDYQNSVRVPRNGIEPLRPLRVTGF